MIKPNPGFAQQLADYLEPPLSYRHSGALTASLNVILGTPRFAGKVSNAWLSVSDCGKDESNPLAVALDVKINGVSCMTTKPKILYSSGETINEQRTTQNDADDGVTQAVIDSALNSYVPGDVIAGRFVITRTSSPTSELRDPCCVVELNPDA